MKKLLQNNYAFIDGQNLNLAIRDLGWKIDYKRFRVYLKDKYSINQAFYFVGFVTQNRPLYTFLQECGYTLIFKPTLEYRKGKKLVTKGNVDAELVLHAMIEFGSYDQAIIVSGDGDFHCLIEYLLSKHKLAWVMVPNYLKYSALLRSFIPKLAFLNHLQEKLEYKKRGINLRTKP